MKRIKSIVTGGAGFIGSHIVDRLVNMGQEVIVIDDESSIVNDKFYHNENAKYYKFDISDYDNVRPLFDGVDYVFHLAAKSRIQPAIQNPLACVKTNALGTSIILECSREAGVKKVIYSSTSSAYGKSTEMPLKESQPDDCLNPYSASKVTGEKMCKIYTELYGLNTIIFRYFNIYGDREPLSGPYAPVVGLFLRQAAAQEPLTIVGNGSQRRDFTHVNDVVDANILAMETEHSLYGHIFNVGAGKNYSVLELAKMIKDDVTYIDPRPGEAQETLADITKIKNTLGWSPKHSIKDYIKEKLRIQ